VAHSLEKLSAGGCEADRTKAASAALASGNGLANAIAAWRRAAKPILGLRFHDLRHQAITELAEAGAPDATLMALAGHLSHEMMEHYSHVRMAAKRDALDKLSGGLISHPAGIAKPASDRLH
jgi:integrase